MDRHVGTVRMAYTPFGETALQYGKDLTGVNFLIGTGGIFAYSSAAREVLASALFDPQNAASLRPQDPQMRIDRQYVMAALGLLAEVQPTTALRMLKKVLLPC